jgi:hypothetical protein
VAFFDRTAKRPADRPAVLPRDVIIPAVPGLGLTWYNRGPQYWARRFALSLMWAFALAIIAGIDTGLFAAMLQSSRTGFTIFIVIDALVSAGLAAWVAVRTAQRWNVARKPGRALPPNLRFGRGLAGELLSTLAQLGYLLLVLAAAAALLIFPGLFIALFLSSLMPQTLTERQARLWLAERIGERGHEQAESG